MMMPGVAKNNYHSPYSLSSSTTPELDLNMEEQSAASAAESSTSRPSGPSTEFADDANVSLPVPEVIEMLKNLAACNEKQYKWEVSLAKLETVPESDPNRKQMMDIIEFVERKKTSTKDKAIYLYEQLGQKCHQHGNYIGAAKAFERAAGLRLDVTDQCGVNNADRETITATIRCLESAIINYDTIHKYKHAGTLHYRCARILKMINASREEVEPHHIKALEYFTKPDHELKQRKRIDGLKISCYSSCSTWARTTKRKMVTDENNRLTTTTKMVTTSNHMIKFQENRQPILDSEDDDDDRHFELPPTTLSSSGASTPVVGGSIAAATPATNNSVPSKFDSFSDENAADEDYLEKYLETISDSVNGSGSTPTNLYLNESVPTTPTTPSSLASVAPETTKSVNQHFQQQKHYHESSSSSSVVSTKRAHHHHHSRQSYLAYHHSKQKMYALMSSNSRDSNNQKSGPRCIEDRIESARKLVKKLNKLCPFYEVSTGGNDAGRVYCRICDRYLGAVSSTLKNHVNTQEHRQALEDSQQPMPQTTGGTPMVYQQPQQQQQTPVAIHPTSLISATYSTNPPVTNNEYHHQSSGSGQMVIATAALPLPHRPAAPTWFDNNEPSVAVETSNPLPYQQAPYRLMNGNPGGGSSMIPTQPQSFGSNSMVMMKSTFVPPSPAGHQPGNGGYASNGPPTAIVQY